MKKIFNVFSITIVLLISLTLISCLEPSGSDETKEGVFYLGDDPVYLSESGGYCILPTWKIFKENQIKGKDTVEIFSYNLQMWLTSIDRKNNLQKNDTTNALKIKPMFQSTLYTEENDEGSPKFELVKVTNAKPFKYYRPGEKGDESSLTNLLRFEVMGEDGLNDVLLESQLLKDTLRIGDYLLIARSEKNISPVIDEFPVAIQIPKDLDLKKNWKEPVEPKMVKEERKDRNFFIQ